MTSYLSALYEKASNLVTFHSAPASDPAPQGAAPSQVQPAQQDPDTKAQDIARDVLPTEVTPAEVVVNIQEKNIVDQTSGADDEAPQIVRIVSMTPAAPAEPTPAETNPSVSPVAATASVTVASAPVTPEISRRAQFLGTVSACCQVASACFQCIADRATGVVQFGVLGAASIAGIGLKITSMHKSVGVVNYSWQAAKDLFNGGINSPVGAILGIGVLNDLDYTWDYAIATIVINSAGLVAGAVSTVVYGASLIYDAGGGQHFYEMVEGGNKWMLYPIAAQTAFDATTTATSWNATSYLADIIIANDIFGHPLNRFQNLTTDLNTAIGNAELALAANAASLAMVAGVPLAIYGLSKVATSENVRSCWRSFKDTICCR